MSQHSSRTVTSSQAELERFIPLVNRVMAQTRARIYQNNTHYPDKLFSLFEPHTEAIRKGKASKPTEFGKLLRVQEAEHQIVIDYEVYEQRPEDPVTGSADRRGPRARLGPGSAATGGRPRLLVCC